MCVCVLVYTCWYTRICMRKCKLEWSFETVQCWITDRSTETYALAVYPKALTPRLKNTICHIQPFTLHTYRPLIFVCRHIVLIMVSLSREIALFATNCAPTTSSARWKTKKFAAISIDGSSPTGFSSPKA